MKQQIIVTLGELIAATFSNAKNKQARTKETLALVALSPLMRTPDGKRVRFV